LLALLLYTWGGPQIVITDKVFQIIKTERNQGMRVTDLFRMQLGRKNNSAEEKLFLLKKEKRKGILILRVNILQVLQLILISNILNLFIRRTRIQPQFCTKNCFIVVEEKHLLLLNQYNFDFNLSECHS